jgi:hypothetical protein
MKTWLAWSFVVLTASLPLSIQAAPPLVHYHTEIEQVRWEPLPPREMAKIVERVALALLSKDGLMRLRAVTPAKLQQGDYGLQLRGRIIEDARRFTVYLIFGPGKRSDLPSLFVTSTSARISRKRRSEVERRIADTARRAARQLAAVLTPRVRSLSLQSGLPPIEGSDFSVAWGEIDLPRVAPRTKALRTLLDVRQPDGQRAAAAVELGRYAYDQKAARNALELCLLRDPTASVRIRCAQAIAPAARSHATTQRIVLAAMRREVDENALRRLIDLSRHFSGLSRLEAVATWLSLLADPTTARGAIDEIARLVAAEREVPNLETATAACLQRRSLSSHGRLACASNLLRGMEPKRRLAVVWRYLQTATVWDNVERMTFERIVRSFSGRDTPGAVAQTLARLMLALAVRHSAGRARPIAIRFVGQHAKPSPTVVRRLLGLATDPQLARDALRALSDIGRKSPSLAKLAADSLDELHRAGRMRASLCERDPDRALNRTLKTLRRSAGTATQ